MEEQRRQAAAVRAMAITNEANQRKAAALCQHICLLSESVAKRERQREAAAFHQRPEALALVKDCRAVMQAELFAASSLADERSHPEIASSNLFDAARAHIQATCKLLAAPLDAILADIERDDIEEGARTTPFVGAPSLPSSVDGKIERQREATALCQRLRLLSESVAKRQRSAEFAAQRNQAAARTIFLWRRRRLLLVWINHWTLQRQQRDATLARLRYEQDCCRHTAVAQERRRHHQKLIAR